MDMDMDIDLNSASEENSHSGKVSSESGSVSSFTGSPPTHSATSDDETGSSCSDDDGVMPVEFDNEANLGLGSDEKGDVFHDDGPPVAPDPDSPLADAIKYALWFVDLKFSGASSAASITQQLRVTRACVADMKHDDADMSNIPIDFEQALRRTKHLLLQMVQLDTCVQDHYMFHDDKTECPLCHEPRYTASGRARRAGFYIHPRAWLTQLLLVDKVYEYFSYMEEYVENKNFCEDNDELRDFFTGSIFQDVVQPLCEEHGVNLFKTCVCGICHDEVEISRWPKKNICPILVTIFNVPPWIRNLMTMLGMVGIMPTNCKHPQVYLRPVVKMFATLRPGSAGFQLPRPLGGSETWFAALVAAVNDMRGVSKGNLQQQTPAKVMACNDCMIVGHWIKCYHTTVYLGAVRYLPMDDELRARYKTAFSRCSKLQVMADELPPTPITDDYVRLAMADADLSPYALSSKRHPRWKFGFAGTSVFVKYLPYWQPWMMNFRDTDHMLLTRLRLIIALLRGSGNLAMHEKDEDEV